MATVVISKKPRYEPNHPETKQCPKCGRKKKLTDFYQNKEWDEQLGRDMWCKDCFAACQKKEEVKEYYYNNRRRWDDSIWENARQRALAQATANSVYQKSNTARQQVILENLTCKQCAPGTKGVKYQYFDPAAENMPAVYSEAVKSGAVEVEKDDNAKSWNEEWFGEYTARELEFLNSYYQRMKHDQDGNELEFDAYLDDAAHNIAVQAMIVKKLQTEFRAGKASISDVKDAQTILDTLNKSANFATCKRKEEAEQEQYSVGEIAQYLETHGHPMTRKIEWEQDDVDKTIAELYHIVQAVGLDQ